MMAVPEIRLLHSSDWHLELPLTGLGPLPESLQEIAREAGYLAAQQVVETALVEEVDGVLLAGDLVDLASSGPRAIVFLQEQFERLASRDVPVFWAGGVVDSPDRWPAVAKLPGNVHRFPIGHVEQHDLKREGEILAHIQGTSSQENGRVEVSGFHRDAHGKFTAGVAYSTTDSPGREGDRVHYMALGGRHRRATVDTEPGIAHYAGSPQGRNPQEAGPAGCTLVQVREGETLTKFIGTDVVRWGHESLEVTSSTTLEQLEERLQERMERLAAKTQGTDLLVTWHLRGTGPLIHTLRTAKEVTALVGRLRQRAERASLPCWSVALECDSPMIPPAEWYDQETILGDFLRQVRAYEAESELAFDLASMLPAALPDESLRQVGKEPSDHQRQMLLERAKNLGIDLLTSPAASEELKK